MASLWTLCYLGPMSMNFSLIRDSAQMDLYLFRTMQELDIQFPRSYFQNAKTFVSYEGSEPVAGYSIIIEPPFRVLSSVPTSARSPIYDTLQQSSVEVTGFWIAEKHRLKLNILKILSSLSAELKMIALETNKKFAVYAYDHEQEQLKKIYKRADPTLIFSGLTIPQEGMSKSKIECVEYIDILTLQDRIHKKYARLAEAL